MDNYSLIQEDNNNPAINPDYYKNIINDHIETYLQDNGIKRDKLTANDLLSVYQTIYNHIFKPPKNKPDNAKCNINYTEENITALWEVYINITLSYKVPPSVFAFSVLTGIQEETTKKYVTSARIETLNYRREMLRNELYTDKMGRIVLANNDQSYGLEYEKKNNVEREQIKQGLTLQDLPQITG